MVPIRMSAWVLALSTLTWVVAPLPIRSVKRLRSRCGAVELRLIPGEHALGLLDLGVDLARVEGEQQIALVDPGAVLEMHRDDGGLDPRLQRHAGNRRHRPDRIDIDRHRLALGLGQFDRDHARTLRSLRTGAAHPAMKRGHVGGQRRNRQHARQQIIRLRFFHHISRQPVCNDRDGPVSLPLDGAFAPYAKRLSQRRGVMVCQ